MNAKRGVYNVLFGLFYQVIVIAFGLIIPRMFILNFGSEVNGMVSSITQIYTYVALLEAGVGTATLQALFGSVAKDDRNQTNRILAATNHFYKKTGMYYLVAVFALSLIYPIVVKSEINRFVIMGVILFNGLGGVINYFFQAKYRILLQAEGKSYLLSNLSTVIYLLSSVSKIVLIQLGFNVVSVQATYFFLNIAQMGYITWYIKRHYQWIDLSVKPDYDAISQKNSVLIHQIVDLIFNNIDVIILTFVSGLKVVSVYVMYNGFFSMVKSILYSFLNGVNFALGQAYNSNRSRFMKMQDAFELYYMALTFALYTILYLFILPFMSIYTSGIADINYIDKYLPMLFAAIYLLQGARGPTQLVIHYAGHFKKTQNRAILEASINLVVSVICVFKFGIYGVCMGTIAALLYRANDVILYVNKNILKRSPLMTYRRWIVNFILFIIIVNAFGLFNFDLSTYWNLVKYAVPSSVVIMAIYFIVVSLSEWRLFVELLSLIYKRLRH